MNIAAAADQHVVGPAGYSQATCRIKLTEVAGGQPALGIDSAALQIALHDLWATHGDTAAVGNPDFVPIHRLADQTFMPGSVGWCMAGQLRGGFAHAIARVERPASSHGLVVKRAGQGGATDQCGAQAGGGLNAEFEQTTEHGRDQRKVSDAVRLQVAGKYFGHKAVMENNTGSGAGTTPKNGLAANVVKRQAV